MYWLCGAVGFALGAFVVWAFGKRKRVPFKGSRALGTISLGNITCLAGDTMIEVPFDTGIGSPVPVELRASTYDSSGPQPTWEEAIPQTTASPIRMPYDPSSCHDRVVVFGAFAAAPADGAIPCVGSCSSSGSGPIVSETSDHGSVLP